MKTHIAASLVLIGLSLSALAQTTNSITFRVPYEQERAEVGHSIVIESPASMTIDGVSYGAVLDAIANNKALAPDIQRAFAAWLVAKNAEVEKAKEDYKAAVAPSIAAAKAEIEKVKSEYEQKLVEERERTRAAKEAHFRTAFQTAKIIQEAHSKTPGSLKKEIDAAEKILPTPRQILLSIEPSQP